MFITHTSRLLPTIPMHDNNSSPYSGTDMERGILRRVGSVVQIMYSNGFSRGWRQMEEAYAYEQAVTSITDGLAFSLVPLHQCSFIDLKYMNRKGKPLLLLGFCKATLSLAYLWTRLRPDVVRFIFTPDPRNEGWVTTRKLARQPARRDSIGRNSNTFLHALRSDFEVRTPKPP